MPSRQLWIVIAALIMFAADVSCTLDGVAGTSGSIRESRARGVFVREYGSENDIDLAGRTFVVETAWLEKVWYYGRSYRDTELPDDDRGYQIVVVFSGDSNRRLILAGLHRKWKFAAPGGIAGARSLGGEIIDGEVSLSGHFTKDPGSAVEWPILIRQDSGKGRFGPWDTVGRLRLDTVHSQKR